MSSLSWNTGACFALQALPDFDQKRSALLRHIAGSERLLDVRPASRLEVRPRPEMLASGVPELDQLTGGIPRGCLTEIWGTASSGKSTVLLAAMAAATRQDESCVLIDATDSFDPGSAAAAGVQFRKLLWVRCGKSSSAVGRPSSANPFNNDTSIFNAGLPTKTLRVSNRASDRQFQANDVFQRPYHYQKQSSQRRLEQVLKTTDLVLQSGGFGLVVLDLAGIPQKFVRRIPLASWFRFQRAVEHTKTVLLVVSESACAQTCAALVVKLGSQLAAFSSQPSANPSHSQTLRTMHVEAEVVRSRLERKPMQSVRAAFKSQAIRAG